MSSELNRREAHSLSILAAEVVRKMQDKPGTWDFEEVFRAHLDLLEVEIRINENKLSQDAVSSHVGKQLYLFNRGLELQKLKRDSEKKE